MTEIKYHGGFKSYIQHAISNHPVVVLAVSSMHLYQVKIPDIHDGTDLSHTRYAVSY